MAKQDKVNRIFKAIADPTRREIFHVLVMASSVLSLTQISDQFDMSRQGVTKHIRLLEEAGLVKTSIQGRERFCEANPTPLEEIRDWLGVYDRFWESKLKTLEKYLKKKK